MNAQQIKWAQKHDWYIDCSADKDAVFVRGEPGEGNLWFDNFSQLRAWAGY